jgi:hypothetical protein
MSDVICNGVIGWNLFYGGTHFAADLNGDGHDEIIIRSPRGQWVGVLYDHATSLVADWIGYDWINHAGGSGESGWNLHGGDEFIVADINGDGRQEVVVGSSNGQWIGVLQEDGRRLVAGWIGHDWVNQPGGSGTTGWNLRNGDKFLAADINGNGKQEIVVVSPDGKWIGVLYEDNDRLVAGWIGHDWVNPLGGSGNIGWHLRDGDSLTAADIDGDGRQEIVVLSPDRTWIGILHERDGALVAGWTCHHWVNHPGGSGDTGWHLRDGDKIVVADINGDGRDEIVVASPDGVWIGVLFEQDGALVAGWIGHDWVNHPGGSGDTGWHLRQGDRFYAADLDGDDRYEIVVFSPDGDWIGVLYEENGILVAGWIGHDWVNPPGGSGETGWNLRKGNRFEVADINGDGRHELVVFSPSGMWIGVLYEQSGALVAGWIAQHLFNWLNKRHAVESNIVWQGRGSSRKFSAWSSERKAEICQAFELARTGRSIAVPDVPDNLVTLADDDEPTTVLSYSDAWAYYKASLANSLAVEIGGQLPWSILSYTKDEMMQLLDSREFFKWKRSYRGFQIELSLGRIVPAPPVWTREFIEDNDLLGSSRVDCLARVLEWCRDHLSHFMGDATAANMENQWQYRGFPPMKRVLEGTARASNPLGEIKHRTAGCWGTTGLLRALLRIMNIPVKLIVVGDPRHALPWFMADSRYLTHGDDPYNQLVKATPPFPAVEILIDQVKYDTWFGGGVSKAIQSINVGRRTRELAIKYLPDYLLHKYCDDIANGQSHVNGSVFEVFISYYSVAQLEAEDLWVRMDAKIEGFGGCDQVPIW